MHEPDELDGYRAPALEAAARFAIDVDDLVAVSASENVTFRLVATDGASYVIRLHRPGYHTRAELDSERLWLDGLAEAGISVPRPVPTPSGSYYEAVRVGDEVRFAGLALWQPGEIVGDLLDDAPEAGDRTAYFAQLGSLMARMHEQAVAWKPPPGFDRHRLDAEGFLGEQPWWGRFWEHPGLDAADRAALLHGRREVRAALDRYGEPRQRFSVIHADMHLGNLLVDGDRLSVIDFDDAGWGWHQYDIAVAYFHSRDTPGFDVFERAFRSAYSAVRPIGDEEYALVPMFELIRGMAIIGWKMQRPEVVWPDGFFEILKDAVVARCRAFEAPC